MKKSESIDAMTFGNINYRLNKRLEKTTSPLMQLFDRYAGKKPPSNSSAKTMGELKELVSLNSREFTKSQVVYMDALDKDLRGSMREFCEKEGIFFDDPLFDGIRDDVLGLQLRLKLKFQRPRPSQLAQRLNIPLYPFKTIGDPTPSYPSRHAITIYLICSAMAFNDLDNNGMKLMEFAKVVCDNRMNMGVNYQSDITFGVDIAQEVMKTSYFKTRYLVTGIEQNDTKTT